MLRSVIVIAGLLLVIVGYPLVERTMNDCGVTAAFESAPPPPGFVSFCIREKDQCISDGNPADVLKLNDAMWKMLSSINKSINWKTIQLDDREHFGRAEYYAIVRDGYGDCDDMVVTKRAALHRTGIPLHDLRIVVALSPRAVRHALLLITTDHGDYVLNSLTDKIMLWAKTGYISIEQQDGTAMGWEQILRCTE